MARLHAHYRKKRLKRSGRLVRLSNHGSLPGGSTPARERAGGNDAGQNRSHVHAASSNRTFHGIRLVRIVTMVFAREKIRRQTHGSDQSGRAALGSRCQGEPRSILGESSGTTAMASHMGSRLRVDATHVPLVHWWANESGLQCARPSRQQRLGWAYRVGLSQRTRRATIVHICAVDSRGGTSGGSVAWIGHSERRPHHDLYADLS